MTIRDNRDYIRALLSSYYTTITGWGVLPRTTGLRVDGYYAKNRESEGENKY